MKTLPLILAVGSCAALFTSAANAFTVLGTGTGFLVGGDLTGTGTLIIKTNGDKFELKSGTLNWTGDVIVIGNDM